MHQTTIKKLNKELLEINIELKKAEKKLDYGVALLSAPKKRIKKKKEKEKS